MVLRICWSSSGHSLLNGSVYTPRGWVLLAAIRSCFHISDIYSLPELSEERRRAWDQSLAGVMHDLKLSKTRFLLPSDHLPPWLDAHKPSTRTPTNTVFLMLPQNTHGVLRAIPAVVGPSVMHEGWVLKKRRKKMQGTGILLPASTVH